MMPYLDTREFYAWYYEKVIDAAQKIFREEINPVTLTMASAPFGRTFNPPNLDVRRASGSSWRGCQQWTLAAGKWTRNAKARAPGFALVWGHFDWSVITENVLWGFVLTRSGHNNYWVDVPLTFNADMTHTRASWAIRRWRHKTAHAERLLLDAKPSLSEAAVLNATAFNTNWIRRFSGRMTKSVKISLNQAGFGFTDADWKDLSKHKIIFAMFSSALSEKQARALSRYVEGGGTLVLGQRFATHNKYRIPFKTSPGHGLAERWGLRVTGKNDRITRKSRQGRKKVTAKLDGLGPAFAGLKLESRRALTEKVKSKGWKRLVRYPDNAPALLTRKMGKGRLVYLNAGYWVHKYIQWVTDTGPKRQGFFRLIEKLCADAGARRTFRIDGNPAETLHMAALDWTDPSGKIGYAVVRTQGQGVWTSGKLSWLGPQTAGYDVFGGDPTRPAPVYGKKVSLHLRPGAGRVLAFTRKPIAAVKVRPRSKRLTLGTPLQINVKILDRTGKPVPGAFPLEVRVKSGKGDILSLSRDLSLKSGGTVRLRTALNESPGEWTVSVRDGISRISGSATVTARAPRGVKSAPDFPAWGQPSELWEAERMPAGEFVDKLKKLADIYRRDMGKETWMVKQQLGAHYSFFGRTRHALIRDLWRVDWRAHAKALRGAVQGGANLILVGEDLGLDPATGLTISPYQKAMQLAAVVKAMKGAAWSGLSADGEVVRARLGRGSLVLSRLTPDGASSSWSYARFWLERLQRTLKTRPAHRKISAPNERSLRRWLSGKETLVKGSRSIEWTGGWEDEVHRRPVWKDVWKQAFNPKKHTTGPVFLLRLPPTGKVRSARIELAVESKGKVSVDIGADGSVEGKANAARSIPLAKAVSSHLSWRERACGGVERDLNAWRLVPIRFQADVPFKVQVKSVTVKLR